MSLILSPASMILPFLIILLFIFYNLFTIYLDSTNFKKQSNKNIKIHQIPYSSIIQNKKCKKCIYKVYRSSVTLGDLLDFFLLLKSIWRLLIALLSVDDLISQTFSNGLVVSHWVLSGSVGQQVNGQVDSSHWWHVHGLLSGNTSCTNLGWVFSWTSKLDGLNEDFKWVSASQKVNDFESVSDDSDGLDFFTSVSAVELEWSDESFDDGGKSLSELFGLISASSVGDEDLGFGGFDGDVVLEAWVIDLGLGKGLLGNHHSST